MDVLSRFSIDSYEVNTMKKNMRIWFSALSAVVMCIIILDSKTAFLGTTAGIEICLKTVIPSLFPFLILSVLINGNLKGLNIPILRPIGRLTGIPAGCEYILLLGLLGGYPVGAQCIADAHKNGYIDTPTARRMLGFCSNAGPAFIFGMVGTLFVKKGVIWALWLIHIASAILTGLLLPGKTYKASQTQAGNPISFTGALEEGVRIMLRICVWVIVFRILLQFLNVWFMESLPPLVQVIFVGLLELSNGCIALQRCAEPIIFVLAGCFLSFGGLCVAMQTVSATGNLSTGWYIPGKILQTTICLGLSVLAQFLLFDNTLPITTSITIALICTIIVATTHIKLIKKKKVVAIPC